MARAGTPSPSPEAPSRGGGEAPEAPTADQKGLLREAARIAGLSSFATPTLEAVERRRFQLWTLTLLLLVAVAVTLTLFALWSDLHPPAWLTPKVVQASLLGLVLLFCAYALEKELQLRRLTRLLVEERVLTAALTNRVGELSSLLEAGKAVNLGLDLDQVLATIVRCAVELLRAHDGSIMMMIGSSELRTVATSGESAAAGARTALGEGIAGRAAAAREPLLISGTVERPAGGRTWLPQPEPPASAMSVPLVHHRNLLGVLNVNAAVGHTFTEHDLRALAVFGEQAASAVANAQLFQAQRLMSSQKLFQALHDPLTRLPNRILFLDHVGHALTRQRSERQRVGVLLVDFDDFNLVNDSLGHAAGDEVLTIFAERLRSAVRGTDMVARFGGDKFAVLLEDVGSAAEGVRTAERVQRAQHRPFTVGGREIRLTGRVGIALEEPGTSGREELLRNADAALSAAKDRPGRVVVFEDTMHADALARLDLESELRRGLERGELIVLFQPICSLDRPHVAGFEALVRWSHPRRGLLPAGTFVPFARHAGILDAIDRLVLEETCRIAGRLSSASPSPAFHVNLSPERLEDDRLVDEIRERIDAAGLPAGRLVLEITEGAMVANTGVAAERLQRLKELGVRLALDDFGTGYSALSHLREFPVDMLKIDRVFVDNLVRDAGTAALVEAIVKLGHGLSLEIVAEGIERPEQASGLLALDCWLGQGWYFSEPLPAAELEEFVRRFEAGERAGQLGA